MDTEINKINESFLQINCEQDMAMNLSEKFAFYTENYKWSPKFKIGAWDGKIRLFNRRNNYLPIGLYDDLLIYFNQNGIKYQNEVENVLGPIFSTKFINKFNKEILQCDFDLRDYQIEAIKQTIKYKKLILLSATGSGKSFIIFLLINLLKYIDDDFKTLLVVPTISLVYQMRDDFIEYGKNFKDYNDYIYLIEGKRKTTDLPITIATWQTVQSSNKNIQDSFFVPFDGIFVDECHLAAATELSRIVGSCINAQYKIGTTGSLKETKTSVMQLKSLFARVYKASSTKKLQKRKILSELEIRNCILDYSKTYREMCKNLNYADECHLIKCFENRKKFICHIVKKAKGNSLVLFRSIKYGEEIYEMIKATNERTYFVYGGTPVQDREAARKIAEKYDNVIIVASYGTFSTGINISRLHNLFFIESMKSLIKVIQSIGRALRLHKTKEKAILYDLVDDLQIGKRKNYVLRHFFKRIGIYDDQGFSYKTRSFKIK